MGTASVYSADVPAGRTASRVNSTAASAYSLDVPAGRAASPVNSIYSLDVPAGRTASPVNSITASVYPIDVPAGRTAPPMNRGHRRQLGSTVTTNLSVPQTWASLMQALLASRSPPIIVGKTSIAGSPTRPK